MEEKGARQNQKRNNEIDDQKFIIELGEEYWKKVLEWGTNRRLLSEMEISGIKMLVNMNKTGRIPGSKQAKTLRKTRERMISEGMPMQF